ncbi:MAG: YeeE/YedE family protein [Myxococcales bacterium]|nr:YeeE/YedE family protein [Myxococcales bacterium]MCB9626619.1 YeeE/YedE family protein [Sandaracinaceae bacterium]
MSARHAATLCVGVLLGFGLSRIGFSSWDEVEAMFALRDPRLIMSFALGVALLVPGWWLMDRLPLAAAAATHRPIHPGTVAGGLLFGVGWAVAGACPAIVLVQVGEGQLAALLTLVGVFAGNAIYALVHRRFFRFSTGSCSGE